MIDDVYADPGRVRIFPVVRDSCPLCGAVHAPQLPHYCGSVYYQMRFQQKYGRMPIWKDAMAHCSAPVKEEMIRYLREKEIPEDEISGKVG